jgi:type IV pilus assembly protein PilM
LRREADANRRILFVNVGAENTVAVISRSGDMMVAKYIDIGGRQFDEAVASHLKLSLGDAAALRRHNAARSPQDRDHEIVHGISDAVRPVYEKLAQQLSLCLRYYSVTFRGQPLTQAVLTGGEATETLAEWLSTRLDLPCEIGNPLRPFGESRIAGPVGQWDIATGLALRETR